jgi:hypothetical protein
LSDTADTPSEYAPDLDARLTLEHLIPKETRRLLDTNTDGLIARELERLNAWVFIDAPKNQI